MPDFTIGPGKKATEVMRDAQIANELAHSLLNTSGNPSFHFEEKIEWVFLLGLHFGADIVVEKQSKLLSIGLKADPNQRLHVPIKEMRIRITGSRLAPPVKAAIRQVFHLNRPAAKGKKGQRR